MRKKVINKRYEIKLTANDSKLVVLDKEQIQFETVWDFQLRQPKQVARPKEIISIQLYGLPYCCGVTELGAFLVEEDLVPDAVLSETVKYLKRFLHKEKSLCLAYFVKQEENGDEDFRERKLMDAMLANGWLKQGGEFKNRRYGSDHTLQGLIYLCQDNQKGNSYVI